ncbi:MAG TPA: hypothetical protein VH108_01500 [Gaiellaceae bacterium]|nr:hypothetical protein [Gaiellaceae bacterium]
MTTQAIDRPFVASTALRSVNFFNGRLLTGDDLSREQATQEALRRRLGRAAGEGIAFGFEVEEQPALTSKQKPVVTVSAGLAVTRSGIALQLDTDLDVAIYRDAATAPPGAEAGNLFADCQPSASGTYTAGAGVYVLTVGPGEEPEGRAPVNGLGNETAVCNVALEAEALAFRLIRLSVPHDRLVEKELLRNRIAYDCFGVAALTEVVIDPFAPGVTSYGLVDTLRTQTLSDDEVPLAVIGWSIDDGIQFVDLWSVRRRLTRRSPEGDWTSFVSDRRRAEGEAMFLQFQAQIDDLVARPSSQFAAVGDEFERLPPIGIVPIAGGTRPGLDVPNFFAGLTTSGPAFVEGARLDALVCGALAFGPIAVDDDELIWLYEVHENADSTVWTTPPGGPYVVFASGYVPYAADAQFDLSHFDYANFALNS